MKQAESMKRIELQLGLAVAGRVLSVVIALMAGRYSAAAGLRATMKVELNSLDLNTTGWVSVDGARHLFTIHGPTNFTVSGHSLRFQIEKVAGTNDLDVTMTGLRTRHRPAGSPVRIEGWVICPAPLRSGLKFWQAAPKTDERMHWQY
jgi:hypothetical protein